MEMSGSVNMKILLHCCCAPCAVYPVAELKKPGHELRLFFSNHIHPYTEWQKRLQTLQDWAENEQLPLIVDQHYELVKFLEQSVYRESRRCFFCYQDRLEKSARLAGKSGFDAFTTTLLYSKFQQHDLICELGQEAGKRHGIEFIYQDFREGWQEGIRVSKELGMYRQQYCGCIYSEGERYLGRKKLYRQT